ncbi:TRAP transporter small permease [Brevibacillus humidisoli]|uniref:TRAP transporter small permease n=1 Tax=Brevibacillus humidisoli TaxID=2895522 RepID=UPI001E29E6DB|nr:TRAP transporter small permease [Brevibacillus humidisoli]UFJ41401.1 TRAP transporter small permease [Brevibacillus humidisoli]
MISIIAGLLDKLLVWLSIATGAALTINMVVAVFFRYVINHAIFWADELSLYLFCWATFLGACLAVKRSDMAAVTVLLDRLPPAARFVVQLVIHVCVLLFAAVIGYYSIIWVMSPSVDQYSPTIPIKLSMLYSILPVGMFCMMVFALEHIVDLVKNRKSGEGENQK